MKIFVAAKHLLSTRVPFCIFKSLFHSCEPSYEILKAKFRKISLQVAKIFAVAKHLLGTRVPFHNFKNQFRSCETSCKLSCKNTSNLRNGLQVAKSPPSCENINRRLNFYLNLWFSHFSFRTPLKVTKKPSKLRSPKISKDPLHWKPKSCASEEDHSAHLRVPCGTQASPFQPWPRREEPKPRLHQLATSDRELYLCWIPCLRLHRPLPFHLRRVKCHLVLLSAGTRWGDQPLHLGQAIRTPRNQFVSLLQKKLELQAQESHSHLHSLNRLL